MDQKKSVLRTTYFSLLSNITLAIIKGVAGIVGNSYALIADAIESVSDVFASILTLFGLKYAHKPADDNHPYGHGRAETLVTFVVVGFLIISALVIAYKSIENILTPHEGPAAWTLIVLTLIILWRELCYRWVKRKSLETNSTLLSADAWHHRSDALTSVAAFIGILLSVTFGEGYESADDWAALFASVIILYNSYLIFRPALGEAMDEHVYDDVVTEVVKIAETVDGILAIENCYVRKAGMSYHLDVSAMVDGKISVTKGHDLAHDLEDTLRQEMKNLAHVLVHIEPYE